MISWAAYNLRCGLHSGFPLCCIAFFLTEWPDWEQERRNQHLKNAPKHVGYVPCPSCMNSKLFVTTRECWCNAQKTKDRPRYPTLSELVKRKEHRRPTYKFPGRYVYKATLEENGFVVLSKTRQRLTAKQRKELVELAAQFKQEEQTDE